MNHSSLPHQYTVTLDDDPLVPRIIAEATGAPSLHFNKLETLLRKAPSLSPIAIFVDVHLGEAQPSGLDIVQKLKKLIPRAVIIVISSTKTEAIIEQAMAVGADDFIRKPLNATELVARLNARLVQKNARLFARIVSWADLHLDLDQSVLMNGEARTHLKPKESKLLSYLMQMNGSISTRETLLRHIWGETSVTANAFDRRIHEIRKAFERINSQVSIESVYGKGVRLNFKKNESSNSKKKKMIKKTSIQDLNVLIVDDNQLNLDVSLALMQHLMIAADVASNGKVAFGLAKRKTYDVILMDCQMPIMDGFEATQKILQSGKSQNAYIAALVGKADERLRKQCFEAGMKDFIFKPLKIEELRTLLEKSIKVHSSGTGTEIKNPDLNAAFDIPADAGLDRETIQNLIAINPDDGVAFVKSMFKTFIESAGPHANDLEKNITNLDQVFRLAHKLRGMCENIGALEIAELYDQIETLAEKKHGDPIKNLVTKTQQKMRRLCQELEKLLTAQ